MKKLTGLMVAMALGAVVALMVACGSSSSKADSGTGPDSHPAADGGGPDGAATIDGGHDAG